jgi:hypothetical protein
MCDTADAAIRARRRFGIRLQSNHQYGGRAHGDEKHLSLPMIFQRTFSQIESQYAYRYRNHVHCVHSSFRFIA